MTQQDDPSLPQVRDCAAGRTAGMWATLLLVWTVGVVSWTVWVLGIGYVLVNILL